MLTELLHKAPEDLVMNQGESYRSTQEDRYLIDRTIPFQDYGKGCESQRYRCPMRIHAETIWCCFCFLCQNFKVEMHTDVDETLCVPLFLHIEVVVWLCGHDSGARCCGFEPWFDQ